ncbi:hypothetical protein [Streptomyces sp. BE303]|uniref:hypothetical protein n=1 Tax=Streptomyces sp. BE303 TaxID=3002528 RepID=UPI002E767E3E|nr:hypothetical protein [Streptomyces sp. BE303]MED7947577.1 hypothetical protein [Streptomyces sp. BE303]
MNRNRLRIGGVAALAALTLTFGGSVAQASTATPAITVTPGQQQAVQSLATALLNSPVAYSAAERAELQQIASGTTALAGKFDGIINLLKKVPGFIKAVGGTYGAFVDWYNGLAWYWKAPLTAANVGGNLYTIWQLFH